MEDTSGNQGIPIPEGIPPGLWDAIKGIHSLRREGTLLEQTENSDLLPQCKPVNRLFFQKVFGQSGTFWDAYETMGLGHRPDDLPYLVFVGNRMYFCRNAADEFIYSTALKRKYRIKKDSLSEDTDISIENANYAIGAILEQGKAVARAAVGMARISEKVEESERYFEFAKTYYRDNIVQAKAQADPLKFEEAVGFAARAMEYSVYASVAYTVNMRFPKSDAVDRCEANELSSLLSSGKPYIDDELRTRYGFMSANPYDLSAPSYSDFPFQARVLPPSPMLESPSLRWRENAKFTAARFLAVAKGSLHAAAKSLGISYSDACYLSNEDLHDCIFRQSRAADKVGPNRSLFEQNSPFPYPPSFLFTADEWVGIDMRGGKDIGGEPVGAPGQFTGEASWVRSDADYGEVPQGGIIICESLSPNLVSLYSKARAVVCKNGGMLSHAAIVAREQGIGCVVKTANIDRINDGDALKVDGKTGKISKE